MTWQDQPEGILMNWLLEADNPEVRYLTLRDLLDKPESDPELKSSRRIAHTQGPIIVDLQNFAKKTPKKF